MCSDDGSVRRISAGWCAQAVGGLGCYQSHVSCPLVGWLVLRRVLLVRLRLGPCDDAG